MDHPDPTTEQEELIDEARKDLRGSTPPKLAALRFKLGQKAKQETEYRIYALYGHLLRVDVLETAMASVAASKGSTTPGVDGITMNHIVNAEGGATAFLVGICEELRAKRYRPQAVKLRFAEQRSIRHLRRHSQRPFRPPEGVSFFQHVHDLGLIAVGAARG